MPTWTSHDAATPSKCPTYEHEEQDIQVEVQAINYKKIRGTQL